MVSLLQIPSFKALFFRVLFRGNLFVPNDSIKEVKSSAILKQFVWINFSYKTAKIHIWIVFFF